MEFRVNFDYADGSEDSFIVEGDSIEEIREEAKDELAKRQGLHPWSEDITKTT
jgi:hypothetical protein